MYYPNRYEGEPRKRKAYIEACDLIEVYGLQRNQWNYLKCGINRIEMKEIWKTATMDMSGKTSYSYAYGG